MPKVYDDVMKKLLRANAQDFVSLARKGLRFETFLPTELDAEHIYADGLIRCWQKNRRKILAHFEFQRNNDKHMGERLLEYSLRASRLNDYLPVISCVICLKKDGPILSPPFISKLSDDEEIIRFHYKVICMWELSVNDLLELKLAGLLPLLPLTKDGKQPEVVDIMIEELLRAEKPELLWMGYVLAGKVFTKNDDLQWIRRRFAMLNDFLEDSPIYQEFLAEAEAKGMAKGVAKGMEEGLAKGVETGKMEAFSHTRQTLSQGLLEIVNTRFPDLKVLARVCVSQIDDTDTLSDLLIKIGMSRTKQEARKLLESFLDA